MGVLRVLGTKGDVPTAWPDTARKRGTKEGLAETRVAQETFENLMRNHQYLAFSVAQRGAPPEQVREFDPAAKEIVITPPLAGG